MLKEPHTYPFKINVLKFFNYIIKREDDIPIYGILKSFSSPSPRTMYTWPCW